MTYWDDDKTVHDGEPIELFKFTGPSSVFTYRLTNHTDVVSYGGYDYTPVPLARTTIAGATHGDSPEVAIEVLASESIVHDYAFDTPPRSLSLTIYRKHGAAGAVITYWQGVVTGITVTGDVASIRASSVLDDVMATTLPTVYFQTLCNHMLFDDRCGVSRSSHKVSTTVAGISGDIIEVASVGGKPSGYFTAGEIVRALDGERRLIIFHSGVYVYVWKQFRTLGVGNSVDLYAGCTHTVTTCRDRFANVDNFGGHPYIPSKDPYIVGWRGIKD